MTRTTGGRDSSEADDLDRNRTTAIAFLNRAAKSLDVLRTIAEGPLVAVHLRVRQGPGEPAAPVVHIFRFDGGLIREFWDIGQEIPPDSPNEAGPF
jgi:predicted SnoaL-like aldol condensation-catalyzing enzyme